MRAGKANGVQRAWVDGRKVYDNGGLNLRTDNTLIENFMLQVFHGGRPDDARFQPNRGQSIRCAPCWCSPSACDERLSTSAWEVSRCTHCCDSAVACKQPLPMQTG